MDTALAWIGWIAEWLGRFVPRVEILRATHGAVKFVRGSKVKVCGPGLHAYWPITTDWVPYPTARQAEELRGQTICTTDGRTILVAGMLIYEVRDLEKLIAHVYDPAQTVKDIALTSVHDVCCGYSWDELQIKQQQRALNAELRSKTQKALSGYGVRVVKVLLTDLAPCKVIKLVQTTAKGED